MKLVPLLTICLAAAPVFGGKGLKPRKSADEYAAKAERDGAVVAATLLSPDEVKKLFSSDLNGGGYSVIEVAVYPKPGQPMDVSIDDFTLRVAGTNTTARAANPSTIAGVLQKGNTKSGGRNIDLYPTVGVGYETGGYDSVTGARRGRGVSTGVGLGVGIGGSDPQPASTPEDRRTMDLELSDQSLPEGTASEPVAGYLFFPSPTKKKTVLYDLEYRGKALEMSVSLRPAK